MRYLKKFLEFRSREELIKYCKEHKIKITEEQIERLRKNFNETFNTDKKLNIESLDKISGGMRTANSDFVKPKPPKNRVIKNAVTMMHPEIIPRIEVCNTLIMSMERASMMQTELRGSTIPKLTIPVTTYEILNNYFGSRFLERTTLNDIINFLLSSESNKLGIKTEECVFLTGLIDSSGLPLDTLAKNYIYSLTPWSSQSRKTP